MTDLFDRLDPPAPRALVDRAPPAATPLAPIPAAGRMPTRGEHACNRCGFAAIYFDGPTPWCWTCAPDAFRPGRAR